MPPKSTKRSHKKLTSEQKLKSILNKIDTVLSAGYDSPDHDAASRLWDVLSALRGPDTVHPSADTIKYATTAVLRKIAFPKTFADDTRNVVRNKAIGKSDTAAMVATRSGDKVRNVVGSHFASHANRGFLALRMTWSDKNK
jgi:hypothetical protein